jgi:hypothetical protein
MWLEATTGMHTGPLRSRMTAEGFSNNPWDTRRSVEVFSVGCVERSRGAVVAANGIEPLTYGL